MAFSLIDETKGAVTITALSKNQLPAWLDSAAEHERNWLTSIGFTADPGKHALVPGEAGKLARVLVGVGDVADVGGTMWALAGLPEALPEDLGPEELAAEAVRVAKAAGARHRVIVGDDLLAENYPTIHAVGRASDRAPRLVDIVWGEPAAPKVTLVGKGVCFDSGGLDLKTASGMRMMKKDMAGAAIMLGLARAIMDANLGVRLRVLLPLVENAVAGNAVHPMDIVRTRKGLTVEIGNTDAEGRLILCDALAEASTDNPALLVDIATLTGAARVALGPELPALYAHIAGRFG